MANARNVYRLQLTASATERMKGVTEKLGVTQIAVCSKVMEWFAAQPAEVKAAILDLYPNRVAADVAALLLTRLAKQKPARTRTAAA